MDALTLTELRSWASFMNHGDTWAKAYARGYREPRFPVPAIQLEVVWPDAANDRGYADMIYIEDVGVAYDPLMVCCWDFWRLTDSEYRGKYQRLYTDAQAKWYRDHGAWDSSKPLYAQEYDGT